VIYGSLKALKFYGELLSLPFQIPVVSSVPKRRGVFLKECGDFELEPGKPSVSCGRAQLTFLELSVEDAKRGELDAIVTLPINKEAIKKAGFKFPGHTEFLANSFGVKDYAMMLANKKLKVVLLTTHLALKEVPSKVKKEEVLSKLKLIWKELPGEKIGVCALNPHGGEGGLFGTEEVEEIEPAVRKAQEEGIEAYGPYPSDTLFYRALKGDFGVVLAMYHDQGLIPVKLLGFNESVNVTLGLPIIRTSVDHGTAYDIVGKGVAEVKSFKAAVLEALELLKKKLCYN
jgi:4-hydroxythreonine-4-phosphate dehydrogenase